MKMLRLSLREIRLILERLLQASGTPAGLLSSVRDCAVFSAILPVAGFARLDTEIALLRGSGPRPLSLDLQGDTQPSVDGAGQHAWFAAETLLDLAIEQYRLTGRGEVQVRNLRSLGEVSVVTGLAEKHGLSAMTYYRDDSATLRISARPAETPTVLDQVRQEGVLLDAAIWWPLYRASHEALAPDSFESRRHAGTIRVEADGRVVGRNDEDETDLAMLTADPARLHTASLS